MCVPELQGSPLGPHVSLLKLAANEALLPSVVHPGGEAVAHRVAPEEHCELPAQELVVASVERFDRVKFCIFQRK